MKSVSFAMFTDVTNSTVVSIFLGLFWEVEFYVANTDERCDAHSKPSPCGST